ncbi:SPOSA6832_01836 [Sporobolomyces salmonicolor]|uniref:SPOSA6832_01836-mRNA-1:cds n=1 Tax=Sporidiobolus salmonicolor TaxID=5005 RepID=A0A0D6EJQ7_SPOSA|nr:SPOSA6832_01836 [Sporobolomyces salmonicolor]
MSSPAAAAPPPSPTPAPVPTGQKPSSYTDTFRGRDAHSKFADPCEVAREESMRCLDRHAYDKSKCTEYRDCKKEWLNQRREDRRAGRDVA